MKTATITQGQTAFPLYDGIAPLIDRYDAFVLDIWGVLHDGITPYDGVRECLETLQKRGKNVLLLSNSPRRSWDVARNKLDGMGLTSELYNHILTSGEASRDYIAAHHAGQKVYSFWDREDPSAFEDIDLTRVYDVAQADFMYGSLLPGNMALLDYEDVLSKALAKNIPFVCGNPDRVVGHGDEMFLCVGALAEWYEKQGGPTIWFGKPYEAVYARAHEMLGTPDKSRIIAVGDSLVTDVAGASNFGIGVLWNVVGIHWEELRMEHAPTQIDPSRIDAAIKGHAAPTALLHGLKL